jgi:hypothetical protein
VDVGIVALDTKEQFGDFIAKQCYEASSTSPTPTDPLFPMVCPFVMGFCDFFAIWKQW